MRWPFPLILTSSMIATEPNCVFRANVVVAFAQHYKYYVGLVGFLRCRACDFQSVPGEYPHVASRIPEPPTENPVYSPLLIFAQVSGSLTCAARTQDPFRTRWLPITKSNGAMYDSTGVSSRFS